MNPAIRVEVEMLQNTFRLEAEGMKALLRGPVVADLTRRAIRVEAAAKRNATGVGGGPKVRTGRLRASIGYRVGVDSTSPYVDIGSSATYGPYLEFGHRNTAHAYPLVTAGGSPVVTKGGRQLFGYVSGKPTRPYPFLRPAMDAARTT